MKLLQRRLDSPFKFALAVGFFAAVFVIEVTDQISDNLAVGFTFKFNAFFLKPLF